MHRFHADFSKAEDGTVCLDARESRHARTVLRLKPGSVVELLDGHGHSARAIVTGEKNGRVCVMVTRGTDKEETAHVEISLGMAVIRPERMDFLIQKACELGAASVMPLLTDRSIVKLSRERWEAKARRWGAIALEACKQCGRADIPRVPPPQPYRDFFKREVSYDMILVPTLALETNPLFSVVQGHKPNSVLVLVGPEGDFTPEEVKLALASGAVPVSLGPRVMRSETAALFVLSALQFYYGH